MIFPASSATSGRLPPSATVSSAHAKLLVQATPDWLVDAEPSRRAALKEAGMRLPDVYAKATPGQRKQLHARFVDSFTAQTALDKTMSALQDIETFAAPLLAKALQARFGVDLNVHTTYVSLKKAVTVGVFNVELNPYEYLKLGLLQAAMHNFEASECEEGAFHASSGFVVQTSTPGQFEALSVALKVHQFLALCRTLDIGAQYQAHIKAFFEPGDGTLRQRYIASQKATMRAAAEWALMQQDITVEDYAMVLSVIGGETSPRLNGNPVWFCDLNLLKLRMTGCVVFVVTRQRFIDRYLVYIPHDPHHPLKHYSEEQMKARFKQVFTTPDSPASSDGSPTAYQRFFSQFVAYSDRPTYFSQFTKDAPQTSSLRKLAPGLPLVKGVLDALNPVSVFTEIKQLPAVPEAAQVPDDDPFLDPIAVLLKGQNLWSANPSLWAYLFEQSQHKAITDAASHAVPTQDVDARVRERKLGFLLNIGLFGLTLIAGFVPVLGEVMLAVMAAQLLKEVADGALEWREGDRKAAKAHLIDVAQNLALIALTAGVGKGLAKLAAVKPEPVIEDLVAVKSPEGKMRLWKPDLAPYASDVTLPVDARPNALGQYTVAGKRYIRIEGSLYEQTFDATQQQWRVLHPRDTEAYQPELMHNHAGAWRLSREQPLSWDHLTLLRRLGHCTEAFSDEVLTTLGEVSGVDDNTLRQVHVDGLPVPAALADTLDWFSADQEVAQVIGQIRRGRGFDNRYECVASLAVDMPRWPAGRVLEVFEGAEPWGASTRFGRPLSSADTRASIKITQRELLSGKLAQRVLADLAEEQTTHFLGRSDRWQGPGNEQAFNERLADYALQRQGAIFDSLSRARAPQPTGPQVFQRRFKSLSSRAGEAVLSAANPQELRQLSSGRVPQRLDDLARIGMQQGRLNRAIAGLHRENLASADSDRLALHSLQHLPGWPGNLRLEIRADSVNGPLLDSIGEASAPVRKYLVKDGDTFQAHDERGEALNSVPPHGRHFYRSVMHALPEGSRQALGFALVSQDAGLQQALAAYARSHRSEMAVILKQRAVRLRPSMRLPHGRLGYEMSGRGQALGDDAGLIQRVREIYPNLSETQARWFVELQSGMGRNPQQIYHLLANRQREFDHLRTTLEAWAGAHAARRQAADSLIHCWRQGLYRSGEPRSVLALWEYEALPPLEADFSHVRELRTPGAAVLGEQGAGLLRQFSGVRRIDLQVEPTDLAGVAERLASLSEVTELSINGVNLAFTPAVLDQLTGMAQLQRLTLNGRMDRLDVSRLQNLRALTVSGSLAVWPEGISATLEHLNLSATQVSSLPQAISQGYHPLWRGLYMNWAALEPGAFISLFERLQRDVSHPLDTDPLVSSYCDSVLRQVSPQYPISVPRIMEEFRLRGRSALEQVQQINDLHLEFRTLTRHLAQWRAREVTVGRHSVEGVYRQLAAQRIQECWRTGLEARLIPGGQPGASHARAPAPVRLDLSGGMLGDLPELPVSGFTHVQELDLGGIRVPLEGLNGFMGRFTQVRRVALNANNLTDLPAALSALNNLQLLDLSNNLLMITPAIQARLNALTGLTSLDLQFNPVGALDVSRLSRLITLDLSRTAIRTWPDGVLQRPALARLDLSYSAITTVPREALSGHDALMAATRLRGCRLSAATLVEIQNYAQRLYRDNPMGLPPAQMPSLGTALYLDEPLGIPRALLAEGRTGGDPVYFPESVAQNPELLLSLPLEPAGQLARATPSMRLQRLDPSLSTTQAVARIDELSSSGLGALEVEARLAEWERQQRHWVTVLNEWIDIPAQRQGGRWLSALDRRRAADRLLHSWRYTLRVTPPLPAEEGLHRLDLSGLTLGDLPAVPQVFDHVTALNLAGVQLSEQGSNPFLRAFTHVQTLVLDRNELSALPEAVFEHRGLTRLEAADNALLSVQSQRLPALQWLDLHGNRLDELEVSDLSSLEMLDVSRNLLEDWPAGVLQLPRLRTLDLSHNRIEVIPAHALAPGNQLLMAGTNLTDNRLFPDEYEELRRYLARTGNGLGFSERQLQEIMQGYEYSDEESLSEADDSAPHPEVETSQTQRNRWFTHVAADSERHRIWDELSAENDGAAFFFCLSQLRHTRDFTQNFEALAQRVWEVLEAIDQHPGLRRDVFARATALRNNVTCGDGRILIFNELETSVYEFNALHTHTSDQEGVRLLRLARGMIRLEDVEAVANEAVQHRPGVDAAEVRLAYRIGLEQRLQLPRQPSSMLYENMAHVTSADLDAAYTRVVSGENGEGFQARLISRTYWQAYLRRTYADRFRALADQQHQQLEALEDRYPNLDSDYRREIQALGARHESERTALSIELSTQACRQLGN